MLMPSTTGKLTPLAVITPRDVAHLEAVDRRMPGQRERPSSDVAGAAGDAHLAAANRQVHVHVGERHGEPAHRELRLLQVSFARVHRCGDLAGDVQTRLEGTARSFHARYHRQRATRGPSAPLWRQVHLGAAAQLLELSSDHGLAREGLLPRVKSKVSGGNTRRSSPTLMGGAADCSASLPAFERTSSAVSPSVARIRSGASSGKRGDIERGGE